MQDKHTESFSDASDEDRTMPLSFEESGEALNVASGPNRRRFGFGAMLFAGIAAVAVVSLFSMRTIARSGAAELPQSDAGMLVETFLKEQGTSKAGGGLPADLLDSDAYASLRIEKDELSKDPFILAGEQAVVNNAADSGAPRMAASPTETPEQRRTAQIEGWNAIVDAGTMELRVQSVMYSARGTSVASVNGKLLKVGDVLTTVKTGLDYRVDAISQGAVRFRARHAEFGVERTIEVSVKGNN
ncbi:MAG: hypothetical protein ACKO3W_09470 [bacterium]